MKINITGNAHNECNSCYMDLDIPESEFRKLIEYYIEERDGWQKVDVNEITIDKRIFYFPANTEIGQSDEQPTN